MKVVSLSREEIEVLMEGVFTSNQQRRFIEYVASNPQSLTLAVNRATAIGNCSAIARRVNKKLMPLGYVIACLPPVSSISNRFGERSNMFEWSLFELPKSSANDSSFDVARGVSK
jgi:hypothetical protein